MNLSKLIHFKKIFIASFSLLVLSSTDDTLAASDLSALSATVPIKSSYQQLLTQRNPVPQLDIDSTSTDAEDVSATPSVKREKSGFTMYIWQPGGTVSEVIARISIKAKNGETYHKERFLGDYKYKIKQKAKFVNGFKLGDRIVVRLYDTNNKFIGYTEFACLPDHTAVNVILSANPSDYQVVRVFYGVDANEDSIVDKNTTTYFDYFTELKDQEVTFLTSSENINITQYQAAGFADVAKNSIYPITFREGEFTLAGKSISTYIPNIAQALTSIPGTLVTLTELTNNPTYQLSQLLSKYRQVGVAKNIQVNFSDISEKHWAKDYIAELAAMEIIGGYPDGTFRPNAPVTRAQLAAILQKVFIKSKVRKAISFQDVPQDYWAYDAIKETYEMGFFTVLNTRKFNPTQKLKRLDVLITLAKALNYKVTGATKQTLSVYSDASSIRNEHKNFIASLTENGVIINYPNQKSLNTAKLATRAEVCALIYRAMASAGEVADFPSQYAIKPIVK
ncbi:S-layer homology domain-containing protein [Okeanomitos corallinicola TIOX110]|uniref:S-layer homology domain-containing protein n=1 Tax=Okeanomitos corallinicola TIOX110 TaxID=3133117 RepID=A0ABZ2UQQ1_9CYAN